MNATTGYPYAEGDRLEERNTYFYSPYGGAAFLAAWRENRAAALDELGAPAAEPPPPAASDEPGSGEALLESLHAQLRDGAVDRRRLDLLLQRFEVGKRLYLQYNDELRPLDRDAFRDLDLYLRFAELLDLLYERQGDLSRLNALMKALDILVSLRADLNGARRGRLARLLEREGRWVAALAERVEVAL